MDYETLKSLLSSIDSLFSSALEITMKPKLFSIPMFSFWLGYLSLLGLFLKIICKHRDRFDKQNMVESSSKNKEKVLTNCDNTELSDAKTIKKICSKDHLH